MGIILDAELTLATPEKLWLSTGLRALDHAIGEHPSFSPTLDLHGGTHIYATENLYRPLVSPPIKHLCYAAIADLFTNLPKSKADPQDVAVRQKLQIASWMSIWPQTREKHTFAQTIYMDHRPSSNLPSPLAHLVSPTLSGTNSARDMVYHTASLP